MEHCSERRPQAPTPSRAGSRSHLHPLVDATADLSIIRNRLMNVIANDIAIAFVFAITGWMLKTYLTHR